MRPAPFVARWELLPAGEGAFTARLALDDDAPFAGHYPGEPILPGSLLVEALFQAAGSALGGDWRLAEICSARFQAPLLPGDVLQARLAFVDGEAGEKLVEATASGRAESGEFKLRLARVAASLPVIEPAADVRSGLSWEQARAQGRALDCDFVRRVLPHRPPALLIDAAIVADAETSKPVMLARKAVTQSERGYALSGELTSFGYPSSLVAESFCQACGLLRASSAPAGAAPRDPSKVPVVARLVKLRFVGEAHPGEILEHRIRLAARMPDGAVFSGESVASGRVVLQVERVVAATAPRPSAG